MEVLKHENNLQKHLFGCENWNFHKNDKEYVLPAEMWIWRSVTKMTQIKHKLNLKVMDEISESRQFIKALERGMKFIGHLLRHNKFMTNVIGGKIGRPRKRYRQDIKILYGDW